MNEDLKTTVVDELIKTTTLLTMLDITTSHEDVPAKIKLNVSVICDMVTERLEDLRIAIIRANRQ